MNGSSLSWADWGWIVPMSVLNVMMIFSFIDGLLFSPPLRGRALSRGAGSDSRVIALSEVQRCCVVIGFLGTLLGTYQVLLAMANTGNAKMLQQMFQGMSTAIVSSIVGCVMFLASAAAEHIVAARWAHLKTDNGHPLDEDRAPAGNGP